MLLIKNMNDGLTIQFSKNEFGVVRGCAINVLHEFAMPAEYNLEKATNKTVEDARLFSDKLRKAYKSINNNNIIFKLSEEEIVYLIKIIEDCIQGIGAEFETLLGRTYIEAIDVRNNFINMLK